MLNFDAKDKALKALKETIELHESYREQVKKISIDLFEQRQKVASEVITAAEAYVNALANSPKEFDKAVSEFRYQALVK